MYVCFYLSTYALMHGFMGFKQIYLFVCIYVCMHPCMSCVYTYVSMYVYTHTHTKIKLHILTQTLVRIHTPTHLHPKHSHKLKAHTQCNLPGQQLHPCSRIPCQLTLTYLLQNLPPLMFFDVCCSLLQSISVCVCCSVLQVFATKSAASDVF